MNAIPFRPSGFNVKRLFAGRALMVVFERASNTIPVPKLNQLRERPSCIHVHFPGMHTESSELARDFRDR